MNMPVELPKFDASIRDLRQIRGVTGDLETILCAAHAGHYRYGKAKFPELVLVTTG